MNGYQPMSTDVYICGTCKATQFDREDGNTCQYCGGTKELILKHAIPPSTGSSSQSSKIGGIKLEVDISQIERIVIGGRLYDMLDGGNVHNKLQKNDKGYFLKEEDFLEMFKLVNPKFANRAKKGE